MYLTVSQSSDARLEPQLSPWKVHLGADCGRGLSGTQDRGSEGQRPSWGLGGSCAGTTACRSPFPGPLLPGGSSLCCPCFWDSSGPSPLGLDLGPWDPAQGGRGASCLCPSRGTRPFRGGLSLPLSRSLLSSEGLHPGLAASQLVLLTERGQGPS